MADPENAEENGGDQKNGKHCGGDGDPLPPFRGEPKCIRIELPIREFTNLLWNSLNEQNKVSLFVRYVDLETGEIEQEIRNKNAE